MQNNHRIGQEVAKIWFGIVENNDDKEKNLGRVKVRIIGFHTPQKAELPTEDLPWAIVANSTSNASINGSGETPHKLKPGSMVYGYFLDGEDCQQPIVLGTIFSRVDLGEIPEFDSTADYFNPGKVYWSDISLNTPEPTTDNEEIAKSKKSSLGNELGEQNDIIADASVGPGKTAMADIAAHISWLLRVYENAKVHKYNNIQVEDLVTLEQQLVRVNDTSTLPDKGLIKIGNEYMTYLAKNEKYLLELTRGVYNTNPETHFKGEEITFPEKEFLDTPVEIVSSVTGKVIDFRKEVDKLIKKIRNYVKWLVNIIKSTLTALVSDALVQLGRFLKSLFPFQTKVIIEALYKVLQQIECDFGDSFVDSIVSKVRDVIENSVNSIINNILKGVDSIINTTNECVQDVFDSILSVSLFVEDVLSIIDKSIKLVSKTTTAANLSTNTNNVRNAISSYNTPSSKDYLKSVASGSVSGVASNVNDINEFVGTVNSVANTIGLLFDLLGIGCNKTTSSPDADIFSKYNSPVKLECAEYFDDLNIVDANYNTYSSFDCSLIDRELNINEVLGLKRRPIKALKKIISQGNLFKEEFDSTPGAEAYNFYGPAKTGTEIDKDGNKQTVVNGKNYRLIADDEQVKIQGNCYIVVDGDYHLKVNGDYHLDVVGEYNLHVGSESKQTFCGEHSSFYKNSAKLNAISGYALSGSKLGFSAAGNIDMDCQGALTLIGGEANMNTTGSFNIACLQYNKAVLFNSISTVVKDTINLSGFNYLNAVGNSVTNLTGNANTTITGNNKSNITGASDSYVTGGVRLSTVSAGEFQYSTNASRITPGLQLENSSFSPHIYRASVHVFQ